MSDRRRVQRCRRRFLSVFPGGFHDATYLDWERDYKWQAHRRWAQSLDARSFAERLAAGEHESLAADVVRIESRTNLLFSFEKMALRDAVRDGDGARAFTEGLFQWLYGRGSEEARFTRWCDVVADLPRRQTRVATWPVVTVFGFLARPRVHMYLKPTVTRVAAEEYGYDFEYRARPQWDTYAGLLEFARTVRRDVDDLRPRDMIDIQSFIWVQGSAEYD
jgi:hypothetical protein